MEVEQIVDLHQPLALRDGAEMDRQHPQRPARRVYDAFERRGLHVELLDGGELGQDVEARPHHRPAGQQHVAELAAAVDHCAIGRNLAGIHVESRAIDPVVAGQQGAEFGRLVGHGGARPMAFDFLQGDDVGALERGGDAPEVIAVVTPFEYWML